MRPDFAGRILLLPHGEAADKRNPAHCFSLSAVSGLGGDIALEDIALHGHLRHGFSHYVYLFLSLL